MFSRPSFQRCVLKQLCPLFPHTIHQVPLERYFPEYVGGANVNKAAKYILWRFMQTNRARLSVYPQYVLSLCTPSLAHASNQSNTSNGHDKHLFSICSSEGNDLTECIKRLGHSVVLAFPLLPFLFTLLCFAFLLFSFSSGSVVLQVVFAIYQW